MAHENGAIPHRRQFLENSLLPNAVRWIIFIRHHRVTHVEARPEPLAEACHHFQIPIVGTFAAALNEQYLLRHRVLLCRRLSMRGPILRRPVSDWRYTFEIRRCRAVT